MAKRIALFNHKGGVSKTTTTFNLGWILAEQGKKVIIVDADPQCNLTGLVLGYQRSELESFYQSEAGKNIRDALLPAFESRPKLIEAVDCLPVGGRDNLYLLPGHLRLSEYEVTLGIAQGLSASIQTLQNLPGSFNFLLNKTAEKYNADYVLLDMNPGMSSINQNLLMTSDFFIIPVNPDYFSMMAIDALTTFLPLWHKWSTKAARLEPLLQAEYPFPAVDPKFLGVIIQKFQPYGGVPAKAFQKRITRINSAVKEKLVPVLKNDSLCLPEEKYIDIGISENFCLASISDFKSLIAKSQNFKTPVFALSDGQLGKAGVVQDNSIKRRDDFRSIFTTLADKVIALTDNG